MQVARRQPADNHQDHRGFNVIFAMIGITSTVQVCFSQEDDINLPFHCERCREELLQQSSA